MEYWNKVKIKQWFYKWLEWTLKRYDEQFNFYTVELDSYLEESFLASFNSEDLELIK